MNSNIEQFMKQNFDGFKKSVELGNIDKDVAYDAVIKSKNSKKIYEFAKDIKGVNIKKLENALIYTQDAYYIYCFAKDIKGANIKKLQNAICQTGDAEYIYKFARDIEGANIEKLKQALKNTKNNLKPQKKKKYLESLINILKQHDYGTI